MSKLTRLRFSFFVFSSVIAPAVCGRTDERRCRFPFCRRNAVSGTCVPGDGAAWAGRIGCHPAAESGLMRNGMPSPLRICALATVMYSVGDLNGRSYAKFHPSLRFSAVYLLLLERLRRPFGPAPDAGGRGSFRHGTVGYFPAVVGGRVSRQSLFRGPGPLRSADAQVLQHWG